MTLVNSSSVLEDKMCEENKTAIASPQLIPVVVILSSISLVTVALNLLVLYAVRSERKLHTVGNLYIVSLSVADLIVGGIVMPINILYLCMSSWSLDRPLCLFWLSMDYVASTASIFSVFILCIDRYRSVQQPLKYLRYRTKTRASATILGAWFLAFLWVIPILSWKHFTNSSETKRAKCETDFYDVTWFKVMTAIINFYLPTFLMLWFYAKIYKAVQQHCQHRENRELVNGSFPSFSEIKLRPENPKVGTKKPGKESPWEVLKRKPKDAGGGPVLKPPSPDPEMKSPVVFSQREDGEVAKHHCFPLSSEQTETVAEGSSGGYEALNQSQLETDEQSLNIHGAGEMSEDQVGGDSQSCSRTDSDTPTEPSSEKGKSRNESNTGLDYIKLTWKRLRSHSRQYVSGMHLNRERKAAKQLGFIMAAFILCWIPYFIFFMVIAFCKSCCNQHVHMFTIWLGYINSTLNPLIYPLCNENFKKTFKKLLHIHS
ncbi:histamine H1 receptor [Dasypus novemcinctus]|uniref:histamine H1 receptor n=1 Tax=Dasypus novemcinctus TaxID=9361 RepID=UPI0000E35C79|nr:histamine H1 receptor [Dasypus novemcinctus]XP_023446873.1 histamine H1 receptor [Dasypus novemcinctus]XP_058144941.1 histamine H1 receptor [Dasypus novemcinctus]